MISELAVLRGTHTVCCRHNCHWLMVTIYRHFPQSITMMITLNSQHAIWSSLCTTNSYLIMDGDSNLTTNVILLRRNRCYLDYQHVLDCGSLSAVVNISVETASAFQISTSTLAKFRSIKVTTMTTSKTIMPRMKTKRKINQPYPQGRQLKRIMKSPQQLCWCKRQLYWNMLSMKLQPKMSNGFFRGR